MTTIHQKAQFKTRSDQDAIMCKPRAAHQALITCNMFATRYEGTALLLSLSEFKSHVIIALLHWLK